MRRIRVIPHSLKTKCTIRRNHFRLLSIGIFISLSAVNTGRAQNTSAEFWPETDIWYRLSPAWRLSSLFSITKYNESMSRDLSMYLQADYSWGKTKRTVFTRLVDDNKAQSMNAWMARGGYMRGLGIGANEGDYSENMLYAEIHKRTPLQGDVLLSMRLRSDLRWLGDDAVFSYRLRYRMMVEKEYKTAGSSIVPYVNAEVYWDSRYSPTIVNRVRLIGGTTIVWGPRLAWEGNMTYQYDPHYNTENLYALNVILHVFFE